jgi:S1-C subfamily serine protease
MSDDEPRPWQIIVVLLFFAIGVAFFLTVAAHSVTYRQPSAGATVMVVTESGHGSGVHIGNGYILTATHVIGKAENVTLKTDKGAKLEAAVLWSNSAYDVSLLRIAEPRALKSVPLSCRTPPVGEHVSVEGNPMKLEFQTTWGRIAGRTQVGGDMWKAVYVLDATIAPGVSGGPVLDVNRNVVGIAVGTMVSGFGPFTRTGPAYSFIVPSRMVCNLMGRA